MSLNWPIFGKIQIEYNTYKFNTILKRSTNFKGKKDPYTHVAKKLVCLKITAMTFGQKKCQKIALYQKRSQQTQVLAPSFGTFFLPVGCALFPMLQLLGSE